jgi:RP/EB family microtubule-associated protein
MMDAAYFTGRKELLEFFNNLLNLNLRKIEDTAPGAVACQLTELIFPGSIPLSRVNWESKSDYEHIQNYKLLQVAFTKHRVQRHVDVDKLIRAKYQDNLEFCQWLKAFYDQSGVFREDYDPAAARARGKGGVKFNSLWSSSGGSSKAPPPPKARPRTAGATSTRPTGASMSPTAASKGKVKPTVATDRTARPLRERAPANESAAGSSGSSQIKTDAVTEALLADAALMKKNADLTTKVTDLEQAVVDIEKERDFYFEKLRNVEVMLQVHQEQGVDGDPDQMVEKIFQILYATAEDGLVVNDEGDVVKVDELAGEDLVDGLVDDGEAI